VRTCLGYYRGSGSTARGCGTNHLRRLQEHPQRGGAISAMNGNDFSANSDGNGDLRGNNNYGNNRLGRQRSKTRSSSGDDSLRSRGDLWPSDDEDDAVVIGDAVMT
jgi:hypothetical protein